MWARLTQTHICRRTLGWSGGGGNQRGTCVSFEDRAHARMVMTTPSRGLSLQSASSAAQKAFIWKGLQTGSAKGGSQSQTDKYSVSNVSDQVVHIECKNVWPKAPLKQKAQVVKWLKDETTSCLGKCEWISFDYQTMRQQRRCTQCENVQSCVKCAISVKCAKC